MYKLKIEGIEIKHRDYFKISVWNISQLFKINFIKTDVIIAYQEPYIFKEEDLRIKAVAISKLKTFINDFRLYQFDNN